MQAALAEQALVVEQAIDTLLPLPEGPELRLLEAMRYATLGGGKRLRGFLVMEVAGLFAVATASAARVAASVEMLHAYSLVHDDLPCMDDDDLRRGKPDAQGVRRGDGGAGGRCAAGPRVRDAGRARHAFRPAGALRTGGRPRRGGGRARDVRRPDDRHGDRGAGADGGRGGPAAGAEDGAADPV